MNEDPRQDDAELVRAAQQGSAQAFTALVVRYEQSARATALRRTCDVTTADDALQDACVIAFRRLATLRDARVFGPWLMRIVDREALRAAKARGKAAISLPADWDSQEHSGDSHAIEEAMALLERLPEADRLLVTMRYFDGLSAGEIAQAMAQPVGTITKRLSRALGRLRQWARPTEKLS